MPRLKLFVNHVAVLPIEPPCSEGKSEASCSKDDKVTQRGIVLMAGPGKVGFAIVFKPGDVVWYDQGVGHWATLGKNRVVIVHDEDVFALESDLEHESAIKSHTLKAIKEAHVTSDGKFEACCPLHEAIPDDPVEPESDPNLQPDGLPSSSSGVRPGPLEPGGELEPKVPPAPLPG